MADPTAVSRHLDGGTRRTSDEHRARTDELLARIEDEELIPQSCWSPMLDTVARLTELSDDLAWLVPAYLSHVIVRGPKMFNAAATQASLLDEREGRPTRSCDACGKDADVSRAVQFHPRLAQLVDCAACGREAVLYDEQPYSGPTLIARGIV